MATAVQVESIWNGLTDNSGQPLAAGKVYTYSAGTTTPVSLYTSSDKSTSATNPLILDGNGKAQVWADGRYKFVVKTSADVTLYTLDNLLYGFDDTTVLLGGISTGSANAQVVSVPATVESYANGQRITFIAGYTNSGAVTLQFNSLAPISIVKGPTSSSLQAGDLIAGQLYSCTYYGGSFRLENVPTPADVQRSRAQVIASVAGINTITGTLTPALTGYETGEVFRFKAANASTSAVTINIDGLGAKAIQYNNAALVAGEIAANVWHEIVYDGTQFQLLNPALSASTRALPASVGQVQDSSPLWGGTSGGTSTAYTITLSPAITAYATGQTFRWIANATVTGAATINVNSVGAKTLQRQGTALVGNEFKTGDVVEMVYDGTQFQITNIASAPIYVDRTNNNVGIGGSPRSTAQKLDVKGRLAIGSGNTDAELVFTRPANADQTAWDLAVRTDVGGSNEDLKLMRFVSNVYAGIATQWTSAGQILIGKSSAATSGTGSYFDPSIAGYPAILVNCKTWSGNLLALQNHHNGTYVGGINYSDTATSFPTSSDYRLKENIVDIDDALGRVAQLKPCRFNFIIKPNETVDGFIAHEVQAVVPNAVEGEKDAVNPDGSIKIQSVDLSKIVPLLTAAIQELNAKVESLEARVAALEA